MEVRTVTVAAPRTTHEGIGAIGMVLTVVVAVIGLQTGGPPAEETVLVEPTTEPAASAEPEPQPAAEAPARPVYVVEPGDTLSSLAARTGTTVEEILAVNSLDDPGALQLGQELALPEGATPPPQPLDPEAPAMEFQIPLRLPPAAPAQAESPTGVELP